MIEKRPIAYVVILLTTCAIGCLFAPRHALAEPKVYVEQSLDFGTVYPFMDFTLVKLDAAGEDPELAEAEGMNNTCNASGGHVGKLLFVGYDGLTVQIDFPDEISLTDHLGNTSGYLRKMNRYSTRTPIEKDGDKVSYVGGILSTSSDINGAWGSITVQITAY